MIIPVAAMEAVAAATAQRLDAVHDMHLNCVSILKRARGFRRLMNFAYAARAPKLMDIPVRVLLVYTSESLTSSRRSSEPSITANSLTWKEKRKLRPNKIFNLPTTS